MVEAQSINARAMDGGWQNSKWKRPESGGNCMPGPRKKRMRNSSRPCLSKNRERWSQPLSNRYKPIWSTGLVKRLELKDGTYTYYRVYTEAYILPVLGHIRLQKLTDAHIQ